MAKSVNPNREILEAALQGLESQKERLDEQISQVRSMLGTRVGRPPKTKSAASVASTNGAVKNGRKKRRPLSAEARKRIAAAQKKRWAAFRKTA